MAEHRPIKRARTGDTGDTVDTEDTGGLVPTDVDIGGGTVLRLLQDPGQTWSEQPDEDTTGSRLWPAALALTSYLLSESPARDWTSVRALELGAGLGLVGLALASRGADVVLTELAGQTNLLRRNATESSSCSTSGVNGTGRVQVEILDWAHPTDAVCDSHFDVVVGSDICYGEAQEDQLLIGLLLRLCGPDTEVFLALSDYREEREDGFASDFFMAADQAGFEAELVRHDHRHRRRPHAPHTRRVTRAS